MRSPALFSLALLAACGGSSSDSDDSSGLRDGSPPEVQITSPADGDTFQENRTFLLEGLVTSSTDASSDLSATWTAGGAELCEPAAPAEDGSTTCEARLEAGQYEIRLSATDQAGQSASSRVLIVVQTTQAPTVSILSPRSDAGPFYSDVPIAFLGRVEDDIDGPEEITAAWRSNLDGALAEPAAPNASGESAIETTLSEGEHVVTLTGTNSGGRNGASLVVLQVGGENRLPTCTFESPEDGGAEQEGTPVTFRALVDDEDIPNSQLEVVLESDLDGVLAELVPTEEGVVEHETSSLSAGTHQILLTATDEVGGACEATLIWTVGSPPILDVISPLDGSVIAVGEPLSLITESSDAFFGPSELEVTWYTPSIGEFIVATPNAEGRTSNLFGGLGAGAHVLTARVTNPDGIYTLVSRDVVINNPPSRPEVRIEPELPVTADGLEAIIDVASVDPEGLEVSYRYAWHLDGELFESSTGPQVASEHTAKGQTWQLDVFPSDGLSEGPAGTSEVTIGNTPPTASAPSIVPEVGPLPAQTHQDLRCVPGLLDDDDPEDTVVPLFAWTVNGSPASSTTDLLPFSEHASGDEVVCIVTPYDGEDEGVPASSPGIFVTNTPPTISSVTISPLEPRANQELTCSWGGFDDPDGDEDQSYVAWFIDGEPVGTGPVLEGGFVRGDTVRCEVTASDGFDDGNTLSAEVEVQNSPPTVDAVAISPPSADTSTPLECSYTGFDDPDGDDDHSRVRWYVNEEPVGTNPTLSQNRTERGDDVRCEVTPHDNIDAGTPISASITIQNAIPSVASVQILPAAPGVLDEVACSWSGFSDADFDEDQSRVQWFVGDEPAGQEPILSGSFVKEDALTCQVTPYDGRDEGEPVLATVLAVNTAPSIDTVQIIPEEPDLDDALSCEWDGFDDPDEGDEDLSIVEWLVGDEVISTSAELDVEVDREQPITCRVTPFDGEDYGEPIERAVMVGNRLPSIDSVSITPLNPVTSNNLLCSYEGFHDPDGDDDHSFIDWFIDGEPAGGGDTLENGLTAKGRNIRCRVTPNDGIASAPPVNATTVIQNSLPSIASATITPSEARIDDPLACSWTGFEDDDPDDTDQSFVEWYRDGSLIGTGESLTSGYRKDDDVICQVTAFDGDDEGNTVTSSIRILNTAPSIGSVTLSPHDPGVGQLMSCSWEGFSDDDPGDTDQSVAEWYVNSIKRGEGPTFSWDFERGDQIECRVRPFDGDDYGVMLADSTTVVNSPPQIDAVVIDPPNPDVSQDLTCDYIGYSDPDNDPSQSRIQWTIEGGETIEGPVLPKGSALRDQSVLCEVTPFDGIDEGLALTASVVIGNAPPSVSGVHITPSEATVLTESLTCNWTFHDDDDDGDESTVLWMRGDEELGDEPTLAGGYVKDDAITCIVTPDDGRDTGEEVATTLVIGNVAPEITGLSFDPAEPLTDSLLRVHAEVDDPDIADIHTFTYRWSVGGAELGLSPTTDRLSGSHFSKGEDVEVEVVASDGDDDSEPVSIETVVANSPPSLTGISFSAPEVQTEQSITCTGEGFDDPDDGDPQIIEYQWRLNSPSGSVLAETATLPSAPDKDNTLFCIATPFDGEDHGVPVQASVPVVNTPPVVEEAWITPPDPLTNTTLNAHVDTYDPDAGDTVTVQYDWDVGSGWMGINSATLPGEHFSRGQSVRMRARGFDGDDWGPWTSSSPIEIGNTPPSITGAALDASTAQFGDTVTCSAVGYSDDDGDPDRSRFRWTHNGSQVSLNATITINADYRDGGLVCTVTAHDDTDAGNVESVSLPVLNTPPVVEFVTIITKDPRTLDDLEIDFDAADPDPGDLDGLTFEFAWYDSGGGLGFTGKTLPSGMTKKDYDYHVRIRTHDGRDWSPWETSEKVLVLNTPPTATSVTISPTTASPGLTSFSCSVDDYHDDDGDREATEFTWIVNSRTVGEGADIVLDVSGGDQVTCRAAVFDGEDYGPTLFASMEVDDPPNLGDTADLISGPIFDQPLGADLGYAWASGDVWVSAWILPDVRAEYPDATLQCRSGKIQSSGDLPPWLGWTTCEESGFNPSLNPHSTGDGLYATEVRVTASGGFSENPVRQTYYLHRSLEGATACDVGFSAEEIADAARHAFRGEARSGFFRPNGSPGEDGYVQLSNPFIAIRFNIPQHQHHGFINPVHHGDFGDTDPRLTGEVQGLSLRRRFELVNGGEYLVMTRRYASRRLEGECGVLNVRRRVPYGQPGAHRYFHCDAIVFDADGVGVCMRLDGGGRLEVSNGWRLGDWRMDYLERLTKWWEGDDNVREGVDNTMWRELVSEYKTVNGHPTSRAFSPKCWTSPNCADNMGTLWGTFGVGRALYLPDADFYDF
ncbi:MAG: hypothetical protein EA397_00535 [Deltaproteobacteria bacterium]|nr:MAG: hypothetical protein EA397_00535 [Deltaproteobacteria bacterium]